MHKAGHVVQLGDVIGRVSALFLEQFHDVSVGGTGAGGNTPHQFGEDLTPGLDLLKRVVDTRYRVTPVGARREGVVRCFQYTYIVSRLAHQPILLEGDLADLRQFHV